MATTVEPLILKNMSMTSTNLTDVIESVGNSFEDHVKKYLYMSIGVLGMISNMFVLVVLFKSPAMRKKVTNIYIINQSMLDFGAAFFLMAGADLVAGEIPFEGILGDIYCKVWTSKLFLWGLLVSSTYNLVVLTVERYLEVVHPIWHKVNFSHNKAYVSVAAAWIIGIGLNASYFLPTCWVGEDGLCILYIGWPNETSRRVFGIFLSIIQFIFPLAVLIYSYGCIALKLAKKVPVGDNRDAGAAGSGKEQEDPYQRAWRNTIKTLFMVALSFVICWSWNQIYFFLMNTAVINDDYSSAFYHFTVIMVFLNCCINPFIYSLKYEQFQQAAKKLFFTRCESNRVGNDPSVTTSTAV